MQSSLAPSAARRKSIPNLKSFDVMSRAMFDYRASTSGLKQRLVFMFCTGESLFFNINAEKVRF